VLTYNELINPTDERVKRILKAAEKHFEEFDYRRASLNQICAEAKISKPTFYRYFDSKQTLFFAARIYMLRNFFNIYDERTKGLDSATRKLAVYFDLVNEFGFSNKMFFQTLHNNPELRKNWIKHPLGLETFMNEVDLAEKVMREGIAGGEFQAFPPRALAHALINSTLLVHTLQRDDTNLLPDGFSSFSEFAFDLLLNGIKKQH